MTRGPQVTRNYWQIRASGNYMILHSESEQRKIKRASPQRGVGWFAQSREFLFLTQCDVRGLTPGPQGLGED